MHALYDLKSQLVKELEGIAQKGEISKSDLETVDTLAHATKNLCKVIEDCESEEYSSRMSRRMYPMSYGMSYADSYDDGMSRRNRDGMGRFDAERGRGSYSDGTAEQIERMMQGADERTRRALQTALQTIRG